MTQRVTTAGRSRSVRSTVAPVLCALGVTLTLAGCAMPQACPEIGWVNSIEVTLSGSADGVDEVQACFDENCVAGSRIDERTWSVPIGMTEHPDEASVQALALDGSVFSETNAELDWVRVGGTEECGGPEAAGPVLLQLD